MLRALSAVLPCTSSTFERRVIRLIMFRVIEKYEFQILRQGLLSGKLYMYVSFVENETIY